MASLIHAPAHGLTAGTPFQFANVVPDDTGVDETVVYWVLASGLTSDDFQFSDTDGGTAITLAYDIESCDLTSPDDYVETSGIMDPPEAMEVPTGLDVTTAVVEDADGHYVSSVTATWDANDQPTARSFVVEFTLVSDDYDDATRFVVAADQTTVTMLGVQGGVRHYCRIARKDVFGDLSEWSTEDSIVSATDTVAPTTPTGLTALNGILSIGAEWDANTEADLSHYEVQLDTVNTFASPDQTYVLKSTALTVNELVAGTYWLRVRAVDLTGNASAWSSGSSCAAREVETGDIAAGAITVTEISDGAISTPKLAANAVTADKIAASSITADRMAIGINANLIGNFSFEDIVSGTFVSNSISLLTDAGAVLGDFWDIVANQGTSGATADVRNLSANARSGSNYLRLVQGSTQSSLRLRSNPVRAFEGQRYVGSVWLRGTVTNTANAKGGMVIGWYDKDMVFLSESILTGASLTVGTSTTLQRHFGTVEAPASTAYLKVEIYNSVSSGASDNIIYDDAFLGLLPEGVSNEAATVVIDEDGITITDGALTFEDVYGQTSMDAYGFGRQWLRYVQNRVFNADFTAGSTSDIAVTEVSGGDSVADYRASVSSSLPGWVVDASGGTVRRQTDTAASGGSYLEFAHTGSGGTQTSSIYQDIPVVPGERPRIRRSWRVVRTANDVAVNIYASYRDVNHAIIGSESGSGLVFSSTISAYVQQTDTLLVGVAPANAAYLRYRFEVVHNTGSGTTVRLNDIVFDQEPGAVSVVSTADLTLTTAYQDITGCTTTRDKGRDYLVIATVDFEMSVAGTGALTAQLLVDGAAITVPLIVSTQPTATTRDQVTQHFVVSTSPTGSGIIKLQAKKAINAGTARAVTDRCTLTVVPI